MLSLSARAACSYTRSSCTVHTVLVLQFHSLWLSCHTITGPPHKRSPRTVHGRIIGVSLMGKEGLISSQLEQPSWTTLPVCTLPSACHRSCIYVVGPSTARVASFPGRFGREKRPGNFRQFKLLLPLPESWKSQSDFSSLSHDNSKPNCVMR